jgi:hypothetical protein
MKNTVEPESPQMTIRNGAFGPDGGDLTLQTHTQNM